MFRKDCNDNCEMISHNYIVTGPTSQKPPYLLQRKERGIEKLLFDIFMYI